MYNAFKKFIKYKKLCGLTSKSIDSYTCNLSSFLKYTDVTPEELTQDDIEDYMLSLLQRNLSISTYASYVRDLKIFLRWMSENYEVQFNYSKIKVPKSQKKIVRVYSSEDIKMIYDFYSDNSWLSLRNKAIISFMLDSGLRQGEICDLLYENIDTRNTSHLKRHLIVRGKGGKVRNVPLGFHSSIYFTEYRSALPEAYQHSEFAFVSRTGVQMSRYSVKNLVYQLNKKMPFEVSSHKLRHNFATNYCVDMYNKNGMIDVYALMYLMGHEDMKTTNKYLHFAMELIACQNSISHLDLIGGIQ